jgi:hypothetical protein
MRKSSEASWVHTHAGIVWLGAWLACAAGCDAEADHGLRIVPVPEALSSAGDGPSACARQLKHVATDNPRCPDGTYRGDVVLSGDRLRQVQGCVHIVGNVWVDTSGRPELVGLRGLHSLECVSGDLTVGPDSGDGTLDSLSGLDQLRAVRALRVQNLPALEDLRGLSALEEAERVDIIGCDSLASLDGLDALRVVRGRLRLSHNATLDSLSGAPRLQAVRELVIEDNASIENLQGLPRELSQLFALSVERNTRLLTLDGLEALTQIQHLFVSDNPRLERLAYFENLRTLESFEIADHPRLTDLGSLPVFEDNAQLELSLRNNTRLASVRGLERITQAYNVNVSGNAALTDLSDWQIQRVHNFMLLSANASLTTLDGLDALRDVAYLRVQANPQLRDLDGLSDLRRAGVIELRNNLALRSVPLKLEK